MPTGPKGQKRPADVIGMPFASCAYAALSNSIYLYKEMIAACGAIAYQWPNIEPPKGAIF